MQKKLASLFMVLVLVICTSMSLGIGVSGNDILYGDANDDTAIDMKDVLAIRKYVANLVIASFNADAADCNGDTTVDMKDILLLRQYVAGFPVILGPGGSSSSTDETTTAAPRTSKSRIPTEPSAHETVDFSDQPAIDMIRGDENVTFGVWWWKIADGVNVETRETYLDFLDYNGITEIYYYCYDRMRTPNNRQETHEFVVSAMKHNMRVSVLYDDPNSQLEENTYFTDTVVANYLEYKKEYPNDWMYGIHCDVEHKVNQSNAQTYVKNFLIPEVAAARAQGIYVELDLKASYTNTNGTVTIGKESMNFYEACARNCDAMIIMSYRTTVTAIMSSVNLTAPYAKKVGTKIVYSIELDDSGEGSGVDFSRKSKKYAYAIFEQFRDQMDAKDYPAGLGFAIHNARAWFELRTENV